MKTIYYNFNEFVEILNNIRYNNGKPSDLNRLKNELNSILERKNKGGCCANLLL